MHILLIRINSSKKIITTILEAIKHKIIPNMKIISIIKKHMSSIIFTQLNQTDIIYQHIISPSTERFISGFIKSSVRSVGAKPIRKWRYTNPHRLEKSK